jgi:hypothetical protein
LREQAFLNRDKLFIWRWVDISEISPLRKLQWIQIPWIQPYVIMHWTRRIRPAAAAFVHKFFEKKSEDHATEHLVQATMLKDLNFDKISTRELREFFDEKNFKGDVQIMLRQYMDIVMKRLAVLHIYMHLYIYVCMNSGIMRV